MKRTSIEKIEGLPEKFKNFTEGALLYDSSSSPNAKVFFIDKEEGYYLKCAERGALEKEATLGRYFHSLGLAPEVMDIITTTKDWMLTRKARGEDATFAKYLQSPQKLSDVLGQTLRALHETDAADCPVQNRTADYLFTAKTNYERGMFDPSTLLTKDITTADAAWCIAEQNAKYLHCDTLLHGDYCLPNIMLKDFKFSAFIDVGGGGVGERHIDLFWGIWSLRYNLKTDRFDERFLDAYGRDRVQPEMLRVISAIECFG